MKKIRVIVCLFFMISCACFGMYVVKEKLTKDQNPPVIRFEEDTLVLNQGATDEELMAGVTAFDEETGDISDRIQIASMSRLMSGGKRTIQYIVFDDANQVGTAERTVVYADYTPPRIYLKEPLRFTAENYEDKMDVLNIGASDSIDGDLSGSIRVSYGVDMYEAKAGSYPVSFQVNNSAGDTCVVSMDLVIVDSSKESGKHYPLLKDYIVYTKVGQELSLQSYLKGIASSTETYIFGAEGTPANINVSRVSIQSKVDYSVPGIYTVEYSYTTRDNVTATTVLYVLVEE